MAGARNQASKNIFSSAVKISYPPGCKEITEELTKDELVKRLKVRVATNSRLNYCLVCLYGVLGVLLLCSEESCLMSLALATIFLSLK